MIHYDRKTYQTFAPKEREDLPMSTLTTSAMAQVCGGCGNPNVCAKYPGIFETACYLGGWVASWF
jgi:hypothetical protein